MMMPLERRDKRGLRLYVVKEEERERERSIAQ